MSTVPPGNLRMLSADSGTLEGVLQKAIVVGENNRAAINQVDTSLVELGKKVDVGFTDVGKRLDTLNTRFLVAVVALVLLCTFSVALNLTLVMNALDKSKTGAVVDSNKDVAKR